MEGSVSTPFRIRNRFWYSSVHMNHCCFVLSCAFMGIVTELTRLWIFALQRSLFGQFSHCSRSKDTCSCCDVPPVYPQELGVYTAGHSSTFVPSWLNTKPPGYRRQAFQKDQYSQGSSFSLPQGHGFLFLNKLCLRPELFPLPATVSVSGCLTETGCHCTYSSHTDNP